MRGLERARARCRGPALRRAARGRGLTRGPGALRAWVRMRARARRRLRALLAQVPAARAACQASGTAKALAATMMRLLSLPVPNTGRCACG